ncbi:MAG: glycosyltransferase family 2 protein [Dysgonamonadaceae bacterium]|jgi:hypothetical protein|nr:glycosyltransferase family 2 protein [Dysgonamonadaceae bacterium]
MYSSNTQIIVVVPCYNEPDVMQTIESLFSCNRAGFGAETILVVNSYEISPESIKDANRRAFNDAALFASEKNTPDFSLYPILIEDLPGKQTGAGLPRKIGMDEAVKRFCAANNKKGVIASMDADTTVEKNYLTEIYRCFTEYGLNSATIEFHHPVKHLHPEDEIRKATEAYEKYLRYYRSALEYTGYPYAYYTIGSAFAVTAETYMKAGGMGKQQAGEDFYFLQKVFPLGKTMFINTTCVYPAARLSDRVPFGTGPAIAKMIGEKKFQKQTYSMEAFHELKQFFDRINCFFHVPYNQIDALIADFPDHLTAFLKENHFETKIEEINRYTTSIESFRKRFFNYFTAFRILKYLNSVHPYPFEWKIIR